MVGLPVDVLHIFADATASMRVKVCSLYPMVNRSGPDMDRAETVTLFNDLCVLAPGAIVDAPVTWRTIHDRRVATFGEARWNAPSPEGPYTYLEFKLDDIDCNVTMSAG